MTYPDELDERQIPLFKDGSPVPFSEIHPLGNADRTVLASPAPVAPLQAPELSVEEDRFEADKRTLRLHVTFFQCEGLEVHLKPEPQRLTISGYDANNGPPKTFSLVEDGRWAYVRFDPPPPGGFDLGLEMPSNEPVEVLLIDVATGLPSFPGIVTEPPGLMIGPPDCSMSIPTDFTAVHKMVRLSVRGQAER